jgi:hypothetical protein
MVFPLLLIVLPGCGVQKNLKDSGTGNIQYNGRVGLRTPGEVAIYWPGSSLKRRFTGTELKATLRDQRGDNYSGTLRHFEAND